MSELTPEERRFKAISEERPPDFVVVINCWVSAEGVQNIRVAGEAADRSISDDELGEKLQRATAGALRILEQANGDEPDEPEEREPWQG